MSELSLPVVREAVELIEAPTGRPGHRSGGRLLRRGAIGRRLPAEDVSGIVILSLRINEPDLPWPRFPEQADRFLSKLVGLALPEGGRDAIGSATVQQRRHDG